MSADSIIIHGHLLKETRESSLLSIEDVARSLTLSNKHIISMEENKKDGFVSLQMKLISIKKYATFLKLDITLVIENASHKNKSLKNEIEKELPLNKKMCTLLKIKSFFLWIKHIKVSHVFYFVIFIFLSNFMIGTYQKYNLAQKNFEGEEVNLPVLASLPNDISTYEIKPMQEKVGVLETTPLETKATETESEALAIKICGQVISKPITQIFSPSDPLKSSNYFHAISKRQQTICVLDSKDQEDKYTMAEGEKLTYRNESPPFKLLIDPTMTDIFYEGWLVKLKPDQNYIQLNPKTYN
ncbi:MAG: hypothetical protein EXR41_03370 [Candidatus Methylopumilus sp.]|nr:hypothetical protein [Candidatus Methylopumilus sp.]